MLHEEITQAILKAFYTVYNALGYGFLEKVYENALAHELGKMDLAVQQQMPIQVTYDGLLVGEYFADLVVGGKVIVELKAAEALRPEHEAQLLNYLKATEMEIGLLLNFGSEPTFRRKIFTNDRKKNWTRKTTDRTDENGSMKFL
jgi:GxxExxY protein